MFDSVEFVTSSRSKPMILHIGCRYNQKTVNKNLTTRWRCVKRICSGSLTTVFNNAIVYKTEHSCVAGWANRKRKSVCKLVGKEHAKSGNQHRSFSMKTF